MDEPPVVAINTVTSFVTEIADEAAADAVEEHERRMHIPPRRRGRVTAIPFANIQLDDSQVSRGWEMMKLGATLEEASLALGVPDLVLVRCLSEYQPAWRQFLAELEAGR